MKALDVLERAISLVHGQRAKDYGDAADSFQRIADGWNIIVRSTDGDLTPEHVALMLDWMKSARLLQSMAHADSWVDKAGYASLGAELALREPERLPTAPSRLNGNGCVGPNDIAPHAADYSQR